MDEPWKCYAKWKKPDTEGKDYMIPHIWGTLDSQVRRHRKQNGGYQWLMGGRMRSELKGTEFFVWDDEKGLEIDSDDGCKTLEMYLMPQICTLKMVEMVNFMLYIFYHNRKMRVWAWESPMVLLGSN